MMFKHTILFSRQAHPGFGGMESHQIALAQQCPIMVTGNGNYQVNGSVRINSLPTLHQLLDFLYDIVERKHISVFFFNDLGFITVIEKLKKTFPHIKFILRSGGNDLYRAPVNNDYIGLTDRQHYICTIINRYIDTLIVNSDYSYLRSFKLGISPKLMKKIRGGVGYINQTNSELGILSDRQTFRGLYGKGRLILVFACRMKKFKGIKEFLDLFVSYPQRHKFFLVFVGTGDQLSLIQSNIFANDMDEQCLFLGELSYCDSLRIISFADYLVNPSIEEKRIYNDESYIHTETMGRSMMEAVSQHVPLIATNVGGTREIFDECKDVGYLIGEPYGLHEILDQILLDPKRYTPMACNYSWKEVFNQYKLIVTPPKKHVLVLDLDDTILHQGEDIAEVKRLLNIKRSKFHLIINTARSYDEHLKKLADYLMTDYCIANNGSHIYSMKPTRWNDSSFLYYQIRQETDDIFCAIKCIFIDCEVKKTQNHIIQLRFINEIQPNDIQRIERLLKGTTFEYINNTHLMKVYSKYISKGAALLFVLKNLFYDKVYGAGNSLNDCLFLKYADYIWLSDDLKCVEFTKTPITYFGKEEVGIKLLTNILKKI